MFGPVGVACLSAFQSYYLNLTTVFYKGELDYPSLVNDCPEWDEEHLFSRELKSILNL